MFQAKVFGVLLGILVATEATLAQTDAAPAAAEQVPPLNVTAPVPAKDSVEKVEVTGSHIKRIDTEGVSPVITVNRKDLDKSGYNSVSDVLRDLSVSSFGAAREASGSNAAGNAEVDLRGLGSSNTLVLLNGQRLPSDAVTGAVDLNLIPMAAVERVEILKDGASAIYGSDALGGVVNIITRKDFTGNEVSVSGDVPEMKGGQKSDISVVNGVNTEKFNMVNVVQYRNNQTVYSRDRFWSANGYSNVGSPGSYRNPNGTWMADPHCPPSQLVHTPDGTFCSFKYSDFSTELPALQQLSLLSEMNYELNSKVKLTARLGGTQKNVQWSFAPAPGDFTIPGSVAGTLGPGGSALPGLTPGQDVETSYRLTELGSRDTQIGTYSYNVLLGASVEVAPQWQLDITTSQNAVDSRDTGVNGYALTSKLQSDITSGQFNPFAPNGQRGSLSNAAYNPQEHTTTQLSSFEVKASGEIAKLESGSLGLAVGSTFTFQKYEDAFDDQSVAGNVFGNAGSSGGGQRDTRSAFTEFSIPLTKQFELQLAARYDHYSDFGDSANPKIAFLYHAMPSLLFRGSVGTGFKAPLMQDLYAATSSGYPSFIDYVACAAEKKAGVAGTPSCLPQQYLVTSGGNTGLKQETSLSYNFGAVYEPTTNFNIGTDWFLSILKNVVGIDYNDAMLAASNGVNLAQYGVIVQRDSNGYITSIQAPLQNLSSQEVQGIDLTSSYRYHQFKLSVDHSQMFYFKEEGFPGAGMRNKLGENGRPGWRDTVALTYTPDVQNELSLIAMTIAGQQKMDQSVGPLSNYTEYDVSYAYKSKTLGAVSAGVKNLLGTTPPLDDSNPTGELNTSLYDQLGRQYVASYKLKF